MKAWALAGILSAVTIPVAFASETTGECQLDESRRTTQQQASPAPSAPTVARPTVAERVGEPARAQTPRRRSGKHIPDAELIGVRGAL